MAKAKHNEREHARPALAAPEIARVPGSNCGTEKGEERGKAGRGLAGCGGSGDAVAGPIS
eukprot:scaffold26358_cov63-Isochrysis_galbana.AAC.2